MCPPTRPAAAPAPAQPGSCPGASWRPARAAAPRSARKSGVCSAMNGMKPRDCASPAPLGLWSTACLCQGGQQLDCLLEPLPHRVVQKPRRRAPLPGGAISATTLTVRAGLLDVRTSPAPAALARGPPAPRGLASAGLRHSRRRPWPAAASPPPHRRSRPPGPDERRDATCHQHATNVGGSKSSRRPQSTTVLQAPQRAWRADDTWRHAADPRGRERRCGGGEAAAGTWRRRDD